MNKKQNSKVKTLAEYACLLALAMLVSFVETLIPVFVGIPGAKLGLANVIIVFVLYKKGPAGALFINISRVLLCGLLFGNMYSILYSFVGALFSFIIMCLVRKIPVFSMFGVSIAGGVAHNMAQLILAVFVTNVPVLLFYIPFLLIVGAMTGLFNGWLAQVIYKRIPEHIDE